MDPQLVVDANVKRPSGNHSNRRREIESSGNIYENVSFQTVDLKRTAPVLSGRKCYRLAAITFGLLFILQAALIISLGLLFFNSENMRASTEWNCKNLTEETNELKRKLDTFDKKVVNIEASLRTVTEERDQLKRKLNDTDYYDYYYAFHNATEGRYVDWPERQQDSGEMEMG